MLYIELLTVLSTALVFDLFRRIHVVVNDLFCRIDVVANDYCIHLVDKHLFAIINKVQELYMYIIYKLYRYIRVIKGHWETALNSSNSNHGFTYMFNKKYERSGFCSVRSFSQTATIVPDVVCRWLFTTCELSSDGVSYDY